MSDERDPEVSRRISQRYRELAREEPSRELDQTILAAAHRAADRPHAPLVAPAGRHRWYFALGAAAVVILAVSVTVHMEPERPDAEAESAALRRAESQEKREEAMTAPAAAAPAKPMMSGRAADAVRAEPPERWVERIIELRKQGKHDEAEKQLAEFRRLHPGYKLPEAAVKRE